jgi:hypothetical protein
MDSSGATKPARRGLGSEKAPPEGQLVDLMEEVGENALGFVASAGGGVSWSWLVCGGRVVV